MAWSRVAGTRARSPAASQYRNKTELGVKETCGRFHWVLPKGESRGRAFPASGKAAVSLLLLPVLGCAPWGLCHFPAHLRFQIFSPLLSPSSQHQAPGCPRQGSCAIPLNVGQERVGLLGPPVQQFAVTWQSPAAWFLPSLSLSDCPQISQPGREAPTEHISRSKIQ